MPLDQAVLEHQVVGGVPAEEGAAPQVDVVVVAARRDMVSSFLEPIRRAGLEPVGIDLSAFGMIRALAGVDPVAEAPPSRPAPPGDAVLYCNVGDVMNLAVARGRSCLFTRVSEHRHGERSPAGSPPRRGLNTEHAAQWLAHVGLERPARGDRGGPGSSSPHAPRPRARESAAWSTSCASRSTTTAPRRALCRSPASSSAGPAARSPASRRGWRSRLGLADRHLPSGRPRRATTPAAAARLTLPYGLALER